MKHKGVIFLEYYIVVYKNTYDAMSSEKVFNENNFEFKIVPTPTSITQSCGICTRLTSRSDIDKIINNKIVEYKNIYKKVDNSFETII